MQWLGVQWLDAQWLCVQWLGVQWLGLRLCVSSFVSVVFHFCVSIPLTILSLPLIPPSYSSPISNSHPGSRSRLFPPPPSPPAPHHARFCFLPRERTLPPVLPSSTRIELRLYRGKQDLRYTQTPVYLAVSTNNIWSCLLWSPVTLCFKLEGDLSRPTHLPQSASKMFRAVAYPLEFAAGVTVTS